VLNMQHGQNSSAHVAAIHRNDRHKRPIEPPSLLITNTHFTGGGVVCGFDSVADIGKKTSGTAEPRWWISDDVRLLFVTGEEEEDGDTTRIILLRQLRSKQNCKRHENDLYIITKANQSLRCSLEDGSITHFRRGYDKEFQRIETDMRLTQLSHGN
ncbi:hypothetical protein M8C21_030075, partial [Ambrosia artemisiifolia]